jgi:hydroxyacylglutathione hydrolase
VNIKQFEVPGLAQYSYMISSEGEAVVIDAIRDFDRYTAYAAEHSLKITNITETHIHADFAAGSVGLAEATGAKLSLSSYDEGELYQYAMTHRRLEDGDAIKVGKLRLEALHTPGHTPEHLSFLLFDGERSATEPVALFSGDFLFVGSLGRPDLLGEDAKPALAHELYRSLHERIADLPDSVLVYPGHGAGSLCGAGMSEGAESTLGYERRTQPLFHLGEEEFVKDILASLPPMPVYYPRMKKLNSSGAPSVSARYGASAIPAAELKWLLTKPRVTVVDLRTPEAFGAGHIRGAINIGAGPSLSLWAGWLIDPERQIVLVGESGDDEESRRALVRVGLDEIFGFLEQGMAGWMEAGYDTEQIPLLSVEEVAGRKDDVLLLDVRNNAEWASGHIAGAQNVMLGDLPQRMEGLSKDAPLVTICEGGYRASVAASLLAAYGFHDVSILEGGMDAWGDKELQTGMEK